MQNAIADIVADVLRKTAAASGVRLERSSSESVPQVLIVGLSADQAAGFSRTYRGVLDLHFDAGSAATLNFALPSRRRL